MTVRSPVAYYGGKTRIADQIVRLLPAHRHYVEPFAGSLAVLLAKPRSQMETVNDLDGELMIWWRMVRDRAGDLERVCGLTPHSRAELAAAYQPADDDLETARRVCVRLNQGRTARMASSGWSYVADPRGGRAERVPQTLLTAVERITPAGGRLFGVSLECRPALDVIGDYGKHPDVLLYVDPPYLRGTRNGTNYRHEMPDPGEHAVLSGALRECKAAVVLSGYSNGLYDDLYADWDRAEIPSLTTQGGEAKATTEVLWSNRPFPKQAQGGLFDLGEVS